MAENYVLAAMNALKKRNELEEATLAREKVHEYATKHGSVYIPSEDLYYGKKLLDIEVRPLYYQKFLPNGQRFWHKRRDDTIEGMSDYQHDMSHHYKYNLDPNTGEIIRKISPTHVNVDSKSEGLKMFESPALQLALGISGEALPLIFNGILGRSSGFNNGTYKVMLNGKTRILLPSHTKSLPREFVLEPLGNDLYYVHMRTWDGDHVPALLSSSDKDLLFTNLDAEIPNGGEILVPKSSPDYPGTRGTIAGIKRLERNPNYYPGIPGELVYTDKNGNLLLYPTTSFIKGELPSASFALGSGDLRYGYDPTNSEHVSIIGKHFKSKYPQSTIYETPMQDTFGWNNDPILVTGSMPAPKSSTAVADLMKQRLNNSRYGWGPQADTEFNYVGGLMRHQTPEYLIDELAGNDIELFLPLSEESNHAHGWYDNGRTLLRMDPWRKKPVRFTTIHEGMSHPTDQMLMPGNPSQGIINKVTGKSLQADYEGVSNPEDLFGDLVKSIGKESKRGKEARAMHWEMISDLLEKGAQEKGLSPTQIRMLPDKGQSIIEAQIEKLLQTPEDLSRYMSTFDSGYLADYAKLLEHPETSSVAKEAYLNRWKKLLKYAPMTLLGTSSLSYPHISELTQSYKNGSKIHIKKKNRGKFTASAKRAGEGVQKHAHKVVNDPNATTLQKRRAQFAINAKKWHH